MNESQKQFVFAEGQSIVGGGQFAVAQPFVPGGQPVVGQPAVHCIDSKESQGFDRAVPPPLTIFVWLNDATLDFLIFNF